MDEFILNHKNQIASLNLPANLVPGLKCQLESVYTSSTLDEDEKSGSHLEHVLSSTSKILEDLYLFKDQSYGALIVMPHVCSWDILAEPGRGLWQALGQLPRVVLDMVWDGLCQCGSADKGSTTLSSDNKDYSSSTLLSDTDLMNAICDSHVLWSRVILFRNLKNGRVQAALPSPPYYPEHQWHDESDTTEADLTGPFPFQYYSDTGRVYDLSLVYVSPSFSFMKGILPTIDFAPTHVCPDPLHRAVRLAGLLGSKAPIFCQQNVKALYADFLHRNHLQRQQKLERDQLAQRTEASFVIGSQRVGHVAAAQVLSVYTDSDDPMELSHSENGLAADQFTMVDSPEQADIIYSYQSLFVPGKLRDILTSRSTAGNPPLINQFPYEGAFVQKDHLAREILRQHGLPLPSWALETYDLDVQMAEFVAAALLAEERGEKPVWIAKPARGTQSKGHVVTTSVAQICRLVDAGGESRVVQRYITNPVCVDGRKVDCRCLVMITNATKGKPTLYMHNNVFFRIAHKEHWIDTPGGRMDNEVVMTAAHLLSDRSSHEPLKTLPTGQKTIAKLEVDYGKVGFDWNKYILPRIRQMVSELFSGMTQAFPAMGESTQSRALYGIDIMFQIDDNAKSITPKLTEVTFCPANNSICEAYELDECLRSTYCTDVFNCLYRDIQSMHISRIQ